jgi:hypothetical protein
MAPWFRLFAGTVVLLVVYFAAPVRADGNLAVRLIVTVLGIGLTVLLIAREIRRVGDAPLWGLAFALVLGILVFAMTDYLIAVSGSGEFEGLQTRLDGLYFAITTLATVGYGDIYAKSQLARGLVTVQMLFNLMVIATGGRILLTQAQERRSSRQ